MRRGQGTRTGQRTRFLARQRLHDEAMLEPIAGDTAAHAGVPPPQARPGDTVTTPSTSYSTNPSRRTCAGGHAAPDEASYPDSRARDSHARGRCSGPAYRERSPSTWPRSKARPSTIGRPTWCSSPNRQRRAAPTPSEPTGAALPNQLVPPAVPARRRRPPPHEPSTLRNAVSAHGWSDRRLRCLLGGRRRRRSARWRRRRDVGCVGEGLVRRRGRDRATPGRGTVLASAPR